MYKNLYKSYTLWTLEIKTLERNREIIENFLIKLNSSTYSYEINPFKNKLKSKIINIKAIFYKKPQTNTIKIFLTKINKNYFNIEVKKEKFLPIFKNNILSNKRIGRFNIKEHKNKNSFNIFKDIIIPAGAGFGTGHHPTTEGIIIFLNKIYFKKLNIKNAIDIGCGSGILSIVMARLWKCKIEAVDIDKLATQTSINNAKINMVNNNINIKKGSFYNISKKNKYDLIVINILAIPIMEMAKEICLKLNKNGRVILSGILKTQIHMVCNKFRNLGLAIDKYYLIKNWAIISLKIYIPPKF